MPSSAESATSCPPSAPGIGADFVQKALETQLNVQQKQGSKKQKNKKPVDEKVAEI